MRHTIQVKQQDKIIEQLPLTDKTYHIGRFPFSDIFLDSAEILPKQGKIVKTKDQILLYNFGKTGDIYVNNRKIQSTVLDLCDTVKIGLFSISFTLLDDTSLAKESVVNIAHLRNMAHGALIDRMNLNKISIDKLGQKELWQRCFELLDNIIEDLPIPKEVNLLSFKANILDEALGLGPLEELLNDDTVTEIMVNGKDKIYVERKGKIELTDLSFTSDENVKNVISRIVNPIGRRIDESMPMVDARLQDGSRVNAIIPPLVLQGPTINIRKFSKKMLNTNDMIRLGAIAGPVMDFLKSCVSAKKNILISGGTGTGKTSFLNIISSFIPHDERVITIEDSAELNLPHEDLLSLEARPPNIEGRGEITIRDLLKNSLRMRPDRIIIGECRGGEAVDMLQAMNTGHEGSMTTIHANSTQDAIMRLETMVLMSGFDLPIPVIQRQIASAVHLIVQQSRFRDGSRKIICVSSIERYENDTIKLQDIFIYRQTGLNKDGHITGNFIATGHRPGFIDDFPIMGINISESVFTKGQVLE